jgi:hypothetical protein
MARDVLLTRQRHPYAYAETFPLINLMLGGASWAVNRYEIRFPTVKWLKSGLSPGTGGFAEVFAIFD